MMIVFFHIWGIFNIEWVPEGRTVNQLYYKEFLTTFRERVKRRPEIWKNSTHTDVYPAVFGEKKIPVLEHPPCSPDLAPRNFVLYPKIKSRLKGAGSQSLGAVEKKRDAAHVRTLKKRFSSLRPTVDNSYDAE